MEEHSRWDRCKWVGCKREPVDEIEMCWYHYRIIGETFMDNHSILGSKFLKAWNEAKPERLAAERERRTEKEQREDDRAAALAEQSVVYYVRIGDHVKIGFTVNMKQRLNGLRVDVDAVLATEPGGRELEKQRHREFANERVSKRENFNPSRRLLAHIDSIREKHGEPQITDYPSFA